MNKSGVSGRVPENSSTAIDNEALADSAGKVESVHSTNEGQGVSAKALEEGKQSWRNLLALDAQFFEQKDIRLLTPEARLLINLKLNDTMTVTEAMEMAGVSYRGFYAVLERLKQAGLVGQVKDKTDQRVRNLRLNPSTPIPTGRL